MLKALKKYRAPYLFIMPFFILFLVFQLVPTIWTFYISLTNWKGIGTPDFCGFDNYRKMLIDDMFWESLGNTVVYWLTGLVFIICCALLIASLLNSRYLKVIPPGHFSRRLPSFRIYVQPLPWVLFSECCLMRTWVWSMRW